MINEQLVYVNLHFVSVCTKNNSVQCLVLMKSPFESGKRISERSTVRWCSGYTKHAQSALSGLGTGRIFPTDRTIANKMYFVSYKFNLSISLDLLLITVVFDQQINNVILPSLIMGYLDKNIGKVRLLFVTFYLINNDWDNI